MFVVQYKSSNIKSLFYYYHIRHEASILYCNRWVDLHSQAQVCLLFLRSLKCFDVGRLGVSLKILQKNNKNKFNFYYTDLGCFPGFYHGVTHFFSLLFKELVEDTAFLFLKLTLEYHLTMTFTDHLGCLYHLLGFREEQFFILNSECSVNPYLRHHDPPTTDNNNMWVSLKLVL